MNIFRRKIISVYTIFEQPFPWFYTFCIVRYKTFKSKYTSSPSPTLFRKERKKDCNYKVTRKGTDNVKLYNKMLKREFVEIYGFKKSLCCQTLRLKFPSKYYFYLK